MKKITISKNCNGEKYVSFPFFCNGKAVDGARWGMTLRSAGSMRFKWNETNENRIQTLQQIGDSFGGRTVAQVQLDHTKLVEVVDGADETFEKISDGIITKNPMLMPVVTVADCMPLFLFDPVTKFFGVVHSGWKGTGIVEKAVELAVQNFSAKPEDICVAIGPHIRSCCYVVNQERADYFFRNFSLDCVKRIEEGEVLCKGAACSWNSGSGPLYRLSLEDANISVLARSGIREENIVIATDCTCCNDIFGSNRRETSLGTEFTVQAAFCVSL